MNEFARIMFDCVYSDVDNAANKTMSKLPIDEIPEGTQKEIKSQIRENMKSLAYYFFCRFDNVGCTLPEEVLSYDIVAHPCSETEEEIVELLPVDIRDGEMDYADMWLDYLHEKNEL